MERVRTLVVAVCLLSLTVGVYAADDLPKPVDPQVQTRIEEIISKLRDKRTKDSEKLQLVARLGEAGAAAARTSATGSAATL